MASPTSYVPGLLNVPARLVGTGIQTLYTSPNGGGGTRITSLQARLTSGNLAIMVVEEGGTASTAEKTYGPVLIATTSTILSGVVLSEGDFIAVQPSVSQGAVVHLMGIEMS